jgi:hypothetical protein
MEPAAARLGAARWLHGAIDRCAGRGGLGDMRLLRGDDGVDGRDVHRAAGIVPEVQCAQQARRCSGGTGDPGELPIKISVNQKPKETNDQ